MEMSFFGCCVDTIFHMNKVVFQILWTRIWLLLWGVPHIFPASCLFWTNLPARQKSMRNTFFEEHLVGCSSLRSPLFVCSFFTWLVLPCLEVGTTVILRCSTGFSTVFFTIPYKYPTNKSPSAGNFGLLFRHILPNCLAGSYNHALN